MRSDGRHRQEHLAADKAGQTVMRWLLADSNRERVEEELEDRSSRHNILPLMQDLSWIVVGGGNIDLFWPWLFPDDSSLRGFSNDEVAKNFLWSGQVFGRVCLALIDWDDEGCANDALLCFSRIAADNISFRNTLARRGPQKKHVARARLWFSLVPALVNLELRFMTGKYRNTDSKLFDAFIQQKARLSNEIYRDFHTAKLFLVHPNGAQAGPALDLYRKISRDSAHDLLGVSHHYGDGSAASMFELARHASFILKQDGLHEDAEWLVAFARKTWPRGDAVSQRAGRNASCQVDPDKKEAKRRPMPTFTKPDTGTHSRPGAPAW